MSLEELARYVAKHHDSCYLLPLSEQYEVGFWNLAMRRAWQMMGLV